MKVVMWRGAFYPASNRFIQIISKKPKVLFLLKTKKNLFWTIKKFVFFFNAQAEKIL